ncbi:2068_t:CDS:2 [Acaulospora morrowiae]|uniref:2068_t:CDS:1 n=1 Tax=Acaulospora morrowiae TaxID=94023 RepID=A0A9N9A9S4_9GLOM|nr:2068_t:CDS:2 [Acaulospora morrowiae]
MNVEQTPKHIIFNDEPSVSRRGVLGNNLFRNGRRFHNLEGVNYPYPNDTIETNRLKLDHYVSKYAWQGTIFYSPLENELTEGDGFRVLDVGCGSGSWLMEMALDYPKSTFIGVDIAEMMTKEKRPQNVGFIQCNVLEGLPFPNNTFNFVYQSNMISAFTEEQWPLMIDEVIRITKPGGWIELEEKHWIFEDSGPTMEELTNEIVKFALSRGINYHMTPFIYELLETNGKLSNLHSGVTIFSLGGDVLGELAFKSFKELFHAIRIPPLDKMSDLEVEKYFETIRQECETKKTSAKLYKFFAQKKL